MTQPPTRGVMARGLFRAVPFVTPQIYVGLVPLGSAHAAEFDTLEGFADPNQYDGIKAFPGPDTPKQKAVGPYLDAAVFADKNTTLLVEYAVDRGASYRPVATATSIPANTFQNISGLRITGRFVRVTLTNADLVGATNVEFGVYVRSA